MILVPELQTVVILNPRTGSGSLYRAVLAKYPRAMMLYRHMEASMIPFGYENWAKVGVVRHPAQRIWSLYNYMKKVSTADYINPYYRAQLVKATSVDFDTFITENLFLFPIPMNDASTLVYDPFRCCTNQFSENRKSQHWWLRPNLGTQVYRYESGLDMLACHLGIKLGHENASDKEPMPPLSVKAQEWFHTVNRWELDVLEYAL